jgi:uncharacterized spore protein YtfJ
VVPPRGSGKGLLSSAESSWVKYRFGSQLDRRFAELGAWNSIATAVAEPKVACEAACEARRCLDGRRHVRCTLATHNALRAGALIFTHDHTEAIMTDINTLFDKAIGEIERMLNTKTVVGEPITIDGRTLIPLISVGFGFGVGAGEGSDPKKGPNSGGGTGAGGGVKPVALVIIDKDGVRVESVKGPAASLLDKVADVAGKFASKKAEAD